jgi:hypothetical protein
VKIKQSVKSFGVDRIQMPRVRAQWLGRMNTIMHLLLVLDQLSNLRIVKTTSALEVVD